MSQENQNTNLVLMDIFVTKLEQQDQKIRVQEKKIASLEQKTNATPDHSQDVQQIKTGIQKITGELQNLRIPTEAIKEFSKLLTSAINLFQRPIENDIRHHHHFPKILWMSGGLFLGLCLVCMGWLATCSNMAQCEAGDIKYRELKLTVDSASQLLLYKMDSLYLSNPDSLKKSVQEQERLRAQRLELIDKINAVNGKILPPGKSAVERKRGL